MIDCTTNSDTMNGLACVAVVIHCISVGPVAANLHGIWSASACHRNCNCVPIHACSGLHYADCRRSIKEYMGYLPRRFAVFQKPVTEEEAPDYFEFIQPKDAMDFDTIKGELQPGWAVQL